MSAHSDPNPTVSEPDPLEAGLAAAFGPDSGPPLPADGSVLKALGAPPLLLREPASEAPDPVVRPHSDALPAEAPARLQLHGEIARGGMGAVLKGRDTDLGRDLAVKVLLETHAGKTELVQRFVEEAQIAGQLQHPGITPVYELGQFADQRPYFTMKLVKGQTLAALLAARPNLAADRPKFVGIFAQICQTLAYAHARGVIHRDLKPANIMAGAFGEVQVMDWGLAKVLPGSGTDEPKAQTPPTVSLIRTQRSRDADTPEAGAQTQAGSVLGTPAYMAPEQARGEGDLVDTRADVFGLGAILCEILTGQPPFTGKKAEALRKAQTAQLDDAGRRLDGCGAEVELIGLARRCLAAEPWDRPRDAGEVAAAVTTYQNSVAERLRQAELAHAAEVARTEEAQATAAHERRAREAAQARAVAEQRARRLSLGLAAAVLALVTVGAVGGLWMQRQRAERVAAESHQREAVETALEKTLALAQQGRWAEAGAVLEQTRDRLADAGLDDLRQRLRQATEDLALVNRLENIRLERASSAAMGGKFDDRTAERGYAAAFREAGLGDDGQPAETVAARVRASAVAENLVAALDDWAATTADHQRRAWLLEVARRADPDPWRDRFRDPKVWGDRAALQKLADELLHPPRQLRELSPHLLTNLGNQLRWAHGDAVPLLVAAQARRPADFWLNFRLGNALLQVNRWDEAVAYYRAAMALRPDSPAVHNNLGNALHGKKDQEGAIASYRRAFEFNPNDAGAYHNLGIVLHEQGDTDGAIASYRRALQIDPRRAPSHYDLGVLFCDVKHDYDQAAVHFRQALALDSNDIKVHISLGNALKGKGDIEGAITSYQHALALDPKQALAHVGLGIALAQKGDVEGASASYRRALQIDPNFVPAYLSLGALYCDVKHDYERAAAHFRQAIALDPKEAVAHYNLGNALKGKGDMEGAIASYRRAVELNPRDMRAHQGLSLGLAARKQWDEAITEFRAALALDPRNAQIHTNLGAALRARGYLEQAIQEYRTALEFDPKHVMAHYNLGNALRQKGNLDGAIASYRRALELAPDHAAAHHNLGSVLAAKKEWDEAIVEYRAAMAQGRGNAGLHADLGNALAVRQQWDAAIQEYRKALELEPKYTAAHLGLGIACEGQGEWDEAIGHYRQAIQCGPNNRSAYLRLGIILCDVKHDYDAAAILFRQAIQLDPKNAEAYQNLGTALAGKGDLDRAIESYRLALRLAPNLAAAHNGLGVALAAKGKMDEAIQSFRRATQIEPNLAWAHINLGTALRAQGDFVEALAALQRGHELGSRQKGWKVPSGKLVLEVQPLADLDSRAAAILNGEAKPRDPSELLRLGRFCREQKKHPTAAARLYARAFAAQPALADDLATGDRYAAAKAAALAGCVQGNDTAKLDEKERARLRQQAVAWLRADLVTWSRQAASDKPGDRARVRQTLEDWQHDNDLAGLRDPVALKKLPAEEREACAKLWAEVAALLQQGQQQPKKPG
jgi:tetratricopeptide (TPR) repeat protein